MLQRLRPSEIRFIQDDINNIFQEGGSVNEAAERLSQGLISVNLFPRIKVVKFGNRYFSFDNRRLYVFRVAEYRGAISHIPVQIVDQSHFLTSRYTTENEGRTVTVRRAVTLAHCKDGWLRDMQPTVDSNTALAYSSDMQAPIENAPEVNIPIPDENIDDDDLMINSGPSRLCPCAIM